MSGSPTLDKLVARADAPAASGQRLVPYVPRLLIEWLRDRPEARWQEVDGTLAFVDISGFTSMTERLARKGKVGAEEMNDVLNTLFTELLAVAYDDGAGLVKWGGDAGLLLFDGDDHAGRACRAAVNMQQTIRRVGRITTSVGQVRLRMSVGMHSGSFDFFLAGDPAIHRELVIAGPGSTETVLMEQIAEAGEVAVSPATAAMVASAVLGAPKDEAVLVRGAPDVPFLSARPGPDVHGVEITSLVPVAIREHLLTGDEQPEHRRITAAFLEFTGTDDLLAQHGHAAVADTVDACVRTVQEAALLHEVAFFETDVARNAWRVMLIAGAPRSAGGDEDRMLATLRTVADADLPLPVRIGTNAGHVFAGHFGPRFRKTYSVKGDAVNLAARLMAKAEPGQILATASVLDPAVGLYGTDALDPFTAKGKRKPVQAWSVGSRVGSKSEGAEFPLAGRDGELKTLQVAVDEARKGNGSATEIVGPPGIGKTRLVKELTGLAPDARVLRAMCEPQQQQIAYRPFRAILRTALDIPKSASTEDAATRLLRCAEEIAPDLVPWLPLLGIAADVEIATTREVSDLGDDFKRGKLEEVTLRFLTALLPELTVLTFEDVHWIDEGSASLLTRLTKEIDRLPWILAVTRRDEATGFVLPDEDACRSLVLTPLTRDEAEDLIAVVTEARPFRRHDLEALATRSAGNPLFLSQLLTGALRTGAAGDLPLTVESLVTVQIDALPASDRRVLRFASVLGMAFDEELVSSLLEVEQQTVEPAAWARLGEFLDGDGPGRRRFRHALMREAAYEGLPFRRRRELHARAGVMIIADSEDPRDHAELLSHHFFEAQTYFDAWEYSEVAGERALAKYANVEAAVFFTRALDAGRRASVSPAKLAQVQEELGDVRFLLNEFEAARAAYAAGRKLVANDAPTQARFLLAEAKVHYRGGRFADAVRSIRRGMRLVEDSRRAEARRMLARLGALYAGVRVSQGRYAEAELWCKRIIESNAGVRELEALARAYYILDFVYMDQGRVEDAVYSARAAQLYERLGDLSNQAEVISNSGADAYEQGEWDRAIDLYEHSLELRRRLGDDGEAASCAANIAEIRLDQGRLHEAEELLLGAARTTRAGGYLPFHAFTTGLLGRAASQAGRFGEAMERFEAARSLFDRVGYRPQVFEVQVRIAELHALVGDGLEALAAADQSLHMASELGGVAPRLPLLQRVRAFAFMQLGQLEEARTALEASLDAARSRKAVHEVGLTLAALTQLDRLQDREPNLDAEEESRSILERLGVARVPGFPIRAAEIEPADMS